MITAAQTAKAQARNAILLATEAEHKANYAAMQAQDEAMAARQ
jgi:hypothetical protein